MSQRSRRFLAAREAAMSDHHGRPPAVVPSLQTMLDEAARPTLERLPDHDVPDESAAGIAEHGAGFLDAARQQITSLTGKLVTWGRNHPARMAGAAAVLIAVSGLLVRAMQRRSQRLGHVHQAVTQVRKRVKSGVRKAATAVGGAMGTGGRGPSKPRLALADAAGRSGRSR